MPRGDKSVDTDKHKGAVRPEAEARAWAAANKLQGGGKKFEARRKLPSGPLGGSGRKTNSSRSS